VVVGSSPTRGESQGSSVGRALKYLFRLVLTY